MLGQRNHGVTSGKPLGIFTDVSAAHQCRTLIYGRRYWWGTLTRILIADDHEVARVGLRRILEAHPNWEIVAEASDGKDAICRAVETKPDVAVIDYFMPMANGLDVTREIRVRAPKTEVLIFTMHDDEGMVQELLKAGARGYLLKSDAKQHLVEAIEALADHKPFFTNKVSKALLDAYLTRSSGDETEILTNRERQIVQLVAEGYTSKHIAKLLNISLKTVETHRAAIMRKLDASSTADLVRYAIRNKII
jgi:DNA-binding NarL/FixJ family response regulator